MNNSKGTNERVFKALANRRRLNIVAYLKHNKRSSVSELAGVIKATLPTTSKHLAILSAVDVVDYERKSLQVYYSLNSAMPQVVRSILKHL
jgi:DNA-binding transcriptional ArsR family regulator